MNFNNPEIASRFGAGRNVLGTLVIGATEIDWEGIWSSCQRRIRHWPIPPNWSAREWIEEMHAEAAVAILRASPDYRSGGSISRSMYLQMRALGDLLTRYRQEWKFAAHRSRVAEMEVIDQRADEQDDVLLRDELRWAMSQLDEADRGLVDRLYWRGETERQIAQSFGISQQAISKKKSRIIENLRSNLSKEGSPNRSAPNRVSGP